jgi:hypothetical protein
MLFDIRFGFMVDCPFQTLRVLPRRAFQRLQLLLQFLGSGVAIFGGFKPNSLDAKSHCFPIHREVCRFAEGTTVIPCFS